MKTKISSAFITLFLALMLIVWYINGSIWSYIGGFWGTLAILLSSLWHSYKKVQNALNHEELIQLAYATTKQYYDDEETNTQKQKKHKPLFAHLKSGLLLCVAPLRLLAYIFFVVIILSLLTHQQFDILSFFIGNSLAIIQLTLFLLLKTRGTFS